MWELDCEEGWALKNWCFWTVVLEKTLESPLDCKEIQPAHSEGDELWDFSGVNDAEAETAVLWPPHEKSWLIGKDWCWEGQEEKGMTEDEMAEWHHWLDGHESQWTPGVGAGQGGLACCDSWGCKELDTTECLKWTECPLEEGMTIHSGILTWRTPWTEEPGGLVHRVANSQTWLTWLSMQWQWTSLLSFWFLVKFIHHEDWCVF